MIRIPDRLAAVAEAIEKGEAVDYRKVAMLQTIDLVRAGRQFVEEAVEFNEQQNGAVIEWLSRTVGRAVPPG
jgi:hypothetical protein